MSFIYFTDILQFCKRNFTPMFKLGAETLSYSFISLCIFYVLARLLKCVLVVSLEILQVMEAFRRWAQQPPMTPPNET